MDEGRMVYFGPWNATAQQLLGRLLPASHMLAAGGSAEQVDPDKAKKAAAKRQQSNVSMSSVKMEAKSNTRKKHGALGVNEAMAVYWRYGGIILGTFTLLVFLATQTSRQLSDWWVRQWTPDAQKFYKT
jgi:ATP-binding cassette, subfamily C (CFTR/MRP), member 1